MDKVGEDFYLEIIIDDFSKQISSTIDDIILRNPLSHFEFSEMLKQIESPRKDELMIAHSDHPFILQVCTYLEEIMLNTSRYERPFCVSIEGHPSSGKSTSLKEIATRLSVLFRDEELKVLPIFSELQIRYDGGKISKSSLWDKIVDGVYSFEFQTSHISETFESFSQFAKKNGLVPILFIDTLDFLITDEHPINQHKIGEVWDSFVNLAIESGVNIIFTTRTDEWNEYFANFSTVKEHIKLSLPELMLPGVDSFYINEAECEHAEEFSQYTRVMQALLPILRHPKEPNYERLSDEELNEMIENYDEQLHHGERIKEAKNSFNKKFGKSIFYNSFTIPLYDWFMKKFLAKNYENSNEDPLFDSPIKLFFDMSWQKWGSLFPEISDHEKLNFRAAFVEAIADETDEHFVRFGTVKYIFNSRELVNKISQKYDGLRTDELFDALRYCDILTINNRYFQFRHQLFHKLTIASWDGFDKQKYSYFFMTGRDNNTDDKIRLLGGIGAWSKIQNPQYEEHQKIIHKFYPRAKFPQSPEQDEEQEDKLIRFFDSNRLIQFISGPAGTGKSRYALKFLDHQLSYRKEDADKLKIAYVTQQPKLRDAQEKIWTTARESVDKESSTDFTLISSKLDSKTEPVFKTVEDLLKLANVTETDKFVDYEEFKNLFDDFVERPSVYHDSNYDFPSSDRAWLEFIEGTYDRVTGKKVDEEKTIYLADRRIYDKFLNQYKIRPYSNWAYRAINAILRDPNPEKFQIFDVMAIDEIQDIYPSVAAYLLCLIKESNRQSVLEKSLLFAGDEEQTINLSGFTWNQYVDDLFILGAGKEIPGLKSKAIFKSFDIQGDVLIERLKYGWRNPKSIATFNHSAFLTYNASRVVKDRYRDLKFIQPKNKRFLSSKIVLIHADIENKDSLTKIVQKLDDVLYTDLEIRSRILNSLMVYPHSLDSEQFNDDFIDEKDNLQIKNTLINSASDIKGREGRSVIIIHPYEWKKLDIYGRGKSKIFQDSGISDKIFNNMKYRMNVLFTRSTSIMFIICPSKSDEIIIEKIDGEDDKLGSHVRPHSLPRSFSNRSEYNDVVEWTLSDLNRENLLAILPERIDSREIGDSYWLKQALDREMNDANLQNREIAWRMYFENRDQTNWKIFDVTARLLTGTTGITTLTQAFSLDEREATRRMYINAINHKSERKCPSCNEQKDTMRLDYFDAENPTLSRDTWLICAECNMKLGSRTSTQREQLKHKFSKFHSDFDDYMLKNADNTFSSSNFLRILEHLRVRALPSRPSKLRVGFIPTPLDLDIEDTFPEITPTKQQISDYINLIYHFKEFLFNEVLKNKKSLLEGDFEETILQLVNQLTGEVEKEKLEFTVMDSLEQLSELEDFLQTIQNMFGLCNSEDTINDYSDTEEFNTLRNFILRSGLFNTHSESFVHTEILENIERIPLTDSIRESSMYRSMTYVVTVINRFIDIALSQRLSPSEIMLLMINDELAEFDYQEEMWSVENPYTILDLALKGVDPSSVVHELVSNKQNYYGLMRNLEFESKKKNQAVIRISTKIAISLVTRDSAYLFQLFGFNGRYTAKVDSIFQLVLWNIAHNQQNLGQQTSNKLIQLVCHYYLAIVECESEGTTTTTVGDGSLFFTIFDNRKHPLEDCQVKIIDHIYDLLTSKSTKEEKIFSYRNYWDIFLIFHSLRHANGNKPLKLLSALLKTLEPNRRSKDRWFSSWKYYNRALIPLEWSQYDRFWQPNLEEDFWQRNMNVLGHTDTIGIESILDHCFAIDKNVGMRLIGCLICQVCNKISHGPFAGLSKNGLLNIFESISHKTSNMATQGIRQGIQSRHFKELFRSIGRFYSESIYVRDSTEDRIKQYREMRDYCVKLVDIHCENLLEIETVTSQDVRVLKQEISSHFSEIPLPLYLSAKYTPTKVKVEADWIEAPYRKWESLYSEDWTERAETIFLARMEQLRLNALDPKRKMSNLVDSLLDYKFGESYSSYISDILYQNYVSEHENKSSQIAWCLGKMIGKTTATENERSCFTCGEINPMPLDDCVCDRCVFDSAGSTVWAERELLVNSRKTIYLLEILFFLYRKDFNYYSKDVKGKYMIFDSLIENLRKLSKKKPKKFIVDNIIEEFNDQAKWGEEWLIDYYYAVSSTPYKLIVEKTVNLILDNWADDAMSNDRKRKNQKTKLQDALDLYFLIPDEKEDLGTERIIRLLSVGFERLLAFNWGYAFNGSTNKYYLISRIDEIISIVDQNKLFTIEQLEKQFTIPEELEFASGYVSQQRESRYYDLLSTTLNEIRKFISSKSDNPTKTAREIIQHFSHVESTGMDLDNLITYFENFVTKSGKLSQCFFDFETIESDEKRYSSIQPKSENIVVCDLSGLGVGRPMQIPKESYVKWARRRELIRDEIESLVAPLDGNDPLLENEIYEWIGDVNVASDWDFLKKENRFDLLSVIATIIDTDYIRFVKETDEIKGSNYHLMSREFFDSLGDRKGELNSNDLVPKEVLFENERGLFSIFVDGSSEE